MSEDAKKLSMIISMALKKSSETEEERRKVEELVEVINRAVEKAEFSREDLIMKSDELYLLARGKIGKKKIVEGVKLLAYVAFGYYVAGDAEHYRRVLNEIEKEVEKAVEELLAWREFDKAYLLWLIPRLLSELDKSAYEEPPSPEFKGNVFPYIRDALKVLVLAIYKKVPDDFFAKRWKRYSEYCEKKNIADYWDMVSSVFQKVKKIKEMEEVYSERAGFEKL